MNDVFDEINADYNNQEDQEGYEDSKKSVNMNTRDAKGINMEPRTRPPQ
jgi:hypothetical protein